jgi:hypothetical protein
VADAAREARAAAVVDAEPGRPTLGAAAGGAPVVAARRLVVARRLAEPAAAQRPTLRQEADGGAAVEAAERQRRVAVRTRRLAGAVLEAPVAGVARRPDQTPQLRSVIR